jgi:hypothetical protein
METPVKQLNPNKPLPLIIEMQTAISKLQSQIKELQSDCARNREMICDLGVGFTPLKSNLSAISPEEIKASLERLSKQTHFDIYAPEKIYAEKFCGATKQNLLDEDTIKEMSEVYSRCPQEQEKKKIGNCEALARDKDEKAEAQALVQRYAELLAMGADKVRNEKPPLKKEQGSGFRSMELSPLMRIVPPAVRTAARCFMRDYPQVRMAAKDVIAALEKMDAAMSDIEWLEEDEYFLVLDHFLSKYAEFEPWAIYNTALALLFDKMKEKEG